MILAAADTFRAAADDQLAVWAKRTGADFISHQQGSDPGAVAFDATRAAIARKADLVFSRYSRKAAHKEEPNGRTKKIIRVISREIPEPHEVILVIDGTNGQNGLPCAGVYGRGRYTEQTTKLDGSSKGGIAAAIKARIPVSLVGAGEGQMT